VPYHTGNAALRHSRALAYVNPIHDLLPAQIDQWRMHAWFGTTLGDRTARRQASACCSALTA